MLMASVISLVSGCATGSYCGLSQGPFRWDSEEEIIQTPIRVIRYVEAEASIWIGECK